MRINLDWLRAIGAVAQCVFSLALMVVAFSLFVVNEPIASGLFLIAAVLVAK